MESALLHYEQAHPLYVTWPCDELETDYPLILPCKEDRYVILPEGIEIFPVEYNDDLQEYQLPMGMPDHGKITWFKENVWDNEQVTIVPSEKGSYFGSPYTEEEKDNLLYLLEALSSYAGTNKGMIKIHMSNGLIQIDQIEDAPFASLRMALVSLKEDIKINVFYGTGDKIAWLQKHLLTDDNVHYGMFLNGEDNNRADLTDRSKLQKAPRHTWSKADSLVVTVAEPCSVSDVCLDVTITNNSDTEQWLERYFAFEVLLEGTWYSVPRRMEGVEYTIDNFPYRILPKSSQIIRFHLEEYASLLPGKYRLVKRLKDGPAVYAEFEMK
ncbi:immunoglobulin-like domain-containing protein [Anaerolentibacter hominis]|uniref:immunoglobulin-like domain-containing protein n=1 Tax=Anaerolentibacter hominis TaxID=3079009 RepID=UPI0031B850C6